jgi:hypothetical protein
MTAAATTTSSKRIDANRCNAQRSTGPTTPQGKLRVRLNALKHGLTATTAILPGEDSDALQSRVDAWKDDVGPRTAMENYLVERAAYASWQLDRADRTIAARLSDRMRQQPADRQSKEADEVADLATRLFWDPRGPIGLYPHYETLGIPPRISTPATPYDPLNPARIVNRLESTVLGCRWLLERWGELKKVLDDGAKWQAPDRLRAIRLLGRQPMDALSDERVMSVYLACWAMDREGKHGFDDLWSELEAGSERMRFLERVDARAICWMPDTPEGGRNMLLDLVAEAAARIQKLLAAHEERNAPEAAVRLDRLAFDDSDDGERLRRYQLAHGRIFLRTVTTLFKVRKEMENHVDDADDCGTGEGPEILQAPFGEGDEIHNSPPDLHVPPAVAPIVPGEAEAETPTTASLVSAVPAPSSTDDEGRRAPALPPDDASSPFECCVHAESAQTQNGETNPTPVAARLGPQLDLCSEGRHIEPAVDSAAAIPAIVRSQTPTRAGANRRTRSNSLPPTMIRLLAEMVMRQSVTGGPTPLRGQGRCGPVDSA